MSEDVVKKANVYDVVKEHFSDIEKARIAGHSYQRIANGLKVAGLRITAISLQVYLSNYRRELKKSGLIVNSTVNAKKVITDKSDIEYTKSRERKVNTPSDIDDFEL